jgi:tetratricopeptide (TPR) repeat protein
MPIEKRHLWLIAATAAVILCTGAALVGIPKYKSWQAKRLLLSARVAADRGAYADASLNLRHILDLLPNDLAAHAMLAELSEKSGDPSAVLWRKRVAELSGGKTDALIAYAAAATRFNQKAAAGEALKAVPPTERATAEYHSAAGALAYASRSFPASVTHYEKAASLAPADLGLQFALANAEMATNDYVLQESGRARLRKLQEDAKFQVKATRSLIGNLANAGEVLAALREARKLVTFPEHEFRDQILFLSLLRGADDSDFHRILASSQQQSMEKPEHARDLLTWMAESGLAKEGIEWATVTNPDLSDLPELQPAIAACYVGAENWTAVLAATHGVNWGPLEYVRHVYRSRALREKGELSLALSDWKIAATAAASRPEAILWLAKTADKWGWPEETEQALWAAVERGADSAWALETLRVRYVKARNTNGLRRVAGQMVKEDPNDLDSQNNFAALSLLLGKEQERAMRLSREIHQQHPDNPDYASTYGYALFRAGDLEGALSVFDKTIPPEKLKEPAVAAYYGIILEGMGNDADARRYLEIAQDGQLLKEELEFVRSALKRLADRGNSAGLAPGIAHGSAPTPISLGDKASR